ncbi:hypothetical protein CCP3SC15_1170012 [Gammaproteobacteria bacterium]
MEKFKYLFFLPAYFPELNPVELIWDNIKPQKIARYTYPER